ncbi:shikimate kinase, partial [Calothrix sp. UHCC 0171]
MIIIVTGVSGSGKSTIGEMLADSLQWDFQDADNFHSLENI